LQSQFTAEMPRLKEVRAEIAEAESEKKKLETEHPGLLAAPIAPNPAATGNTGKEVDLVAKAAELDGLQSRIKTLTTQLNGILAQATNLDQMDANISELHRRKDLEEENYRYYASSLEHSRINEALGAGRVSNITQIQAPSFPIIDWMRFYKLLAEVAISGPVLGLAWAFLTEFYFDRTVKRPKDLEKLVRVPHFLTIPDFRKNGRARRMKRAEKVGPQQRGDANGTATAGDAYKTASGQIAVPEDVPGMLPFHETLRDRMIGFFESRNMTHKPKLIAVTGIGKSAGVTTIAAGLSACLSETGEGNVLLVDLTPGQGSAHQFCRGSAVCGLDEMLATRDSAQVQDKLFVVGGGADGDRLSRVLPPRFAKLVPQLKLSNFDYIIFDMPPVSQISITPRLAGFMDLVLLVVASEKTDQHVVENAAALLAESNAAVGTVLNKARSYVPGWIDHDSLRSA
jgi:Mrp family chromosome partitioning ATPase